MSLLSYKKLKRKDFREREPILSAGKAKATVAIVVAFAPIKLRRMFVLIL